jgi:proline racemase
MSDLSAHPIATYRTVEMHTGGEPVRLIVAGFPEPRGTRVLDKRHDAASRLDLHRRRLMLEPRGHAEMYGALVVPAAPPAAFGVLFMHHSGFSTMCGHATIALGRWAVASGRVPLHDGRAAFIMECPCGPVAVHVADDGARVAFDSVPAFAAALDTSIDLPGAGRILCDIGYGGAFYAILPASRVGLNLQTAPVGQLRAAALAVMQAIRARGEVRHPTEPDTDKPSWVIVLKSAWIEISVADRGIGIEGSELQLIFEPFYRSLQGVAAQIRGTGLGLAIAKRSAEEFGGRVSVVSELGVGSVFTLHLPILDENSNSPTVGSEAKMRQSL